MSREVIIKLLQFGVCGAILLATAGAGGSGSGTSRKTEADLLGMLKSTKYQDVIDALDRLPQRYPGSTNAIGEIKKLLRSSSPLPSPVPANLLQRKAARALGEYHAELDGEEMDIILRFLRAYDPNEVMDGLKALRGLKQTGLLSEKSRASVITLLGDRNVHILRDACRTLAVVGNQSSITALEHLLKHARSDVRQDAKRAVELLKDKL